MSYQKSVSRHDRHRERDPQSSIAPPPAGFRTTNTRVSAARATDTVFNRSMSSSSGRRTDPYGRSLPSNDSNRADRNGRYTASISTPVQVQPLAANDLMSVVARTFVNSTDTSNRSIPDRESNGGYKYLSADWMKNLPREPAQNHQSYNDRTEDRRVDRKGPSREREQNRESHPRRMDVYDKQAYGYDNIDNSLISETMELQRRHAEIQRELAALDGRLTAPPPVAPTVFDVFVPSAAMLAEQRERSEMEIRARQDDLDRRERELERRARELEDRSSRSLRQSTSQQISYPPENRGGMVRDRNSYRNHQQELIDKNREKYWRTQERGKMKREKFVRRTGPRRMIRSRSPQGLRPIERRTPASDSRDKEHQERSSRSRSNGDLGTCVKKEDEEACPISDDDLVLGGLEEISDSEDMPASPNECGTTLEEARRLLVTNCERDLLLPEAREELDQLRKEMNLNDDNEMIYLDSPEIDELVEFDVTEPTEDDVKEASKLFAQIDDVSDGSDNEDATNGHLDVVENVADSNDGSTLAEDASSAAV